MTKFCNVLRTIVKALICIIFTACVGVAFVAVVARYVLNNSIMWAEEFSRYSFNWVIMLACALAVSSNSHMYIDVIYKIIPLKAQKYYQAVLDTVVLVFLGFMIYQSAMLVVGAGVQVSAAMRIPMRVIYMGMPVGFALMLIFGIERLINDLTGKTERFTIDISAQAPDEEGLL